MLLQDLYIPLHENLSKFLASFASSHSLPVIVVRIIGDHLDSFPEKKNQTTGAVLPCVLRKLPSQPYDVKMQFFGIELQQWWPHLAEICAAIMDTDFASWRVRMAHIQPGINQKNIYLHFDRANVVPLIIEECGQLSRFFKKKPLAIVCVVYGQQEKRACDCAECFRQTCWLDCLKRARAYQASETRYLDCHSVDGSLPQETKDAILNIIEYHNFSVSVNFLVALPSRRSGRYVAEFANQMKILRQDLRDDTEINVNYFNSTQSEHQSMETPKEFVELDYINSAENMSILLATIQRCSALKATKSFYELNVKEGTSIQYNIARMKAIITGYEERYGRLVDEKDNNFEANLLTSDAEWDMLFLYIRQCVSTIDRFFSELTDSRPDVTCVPKQVNQLVAAFSRFYSTTRVLLDHRQQHLARLVKARACLVKLLHNYLAFFLHIMNLPSVERM